MAQGSSNRSATNSHNISSTFFFNKFLSPPCFHVFCCHVTSCSQPPNHPSGGSERQLTVVQLRVQLREWGELVTGIEKELVEGLRVARSRKQSRPFLENELENTNVATSPWTVTWSKADKVQTCLQNENRKTINTVIFALLVGKTQL